MNQRMFANLLLGLALTLASLLPAQAVSAESPVRPLYLAVGDSLTVGEGASVPSRFGFVGRLQHFFRVENRGAERFANLGVGGESSTTFITGGQLARAQAAINDPNTDVQFVTLTIGADNFLDLIQPGGLCQTDPSSVECQGAVAAGLAAFRADYLTILDDLTNALTDDEGSEKIFVMNYYNPFGGTGTILEPAVDAVLWGYDGPTTPCPANLNDPNIPFDPQFVGLNDLIACIGSAYGVTVVDAYSLFGDNALALTHIGEQDPHPNNAGYAVIADAFIAALLTP